MVLQSSDPAARYGESERNVNEAVYQGNKAHVSSFHTCPRSHTRVVAYCTSYLGFFIHVDRDVSGSLLGCKPCVDVSSLGLSKQDSSLRSSRDLVLGKHYLGVMEVARCIWPDNGIMCLVSNIKFVQ